MSAPVLVTVDGFTVDAPDADAEQVAEAASAIASGVGAVLAELGRSCTHGRVRLTVGALTAASDE